MKIIIVWFKFLSSLYRTFDKKSISVLFPHKNGCHFADDDFMYIFMNGKFCILIQISLKFVPKGLIDNQSALVQVMAWWHQPTNHYLNQRWPSSLTHICGTKGRWVKCCVVLKFGEQFCKSTVGTPVTFEGKPVALKTHISYLILHDTACMIYYLILNRPRPLITYSWAHKAVSILSCFPRNVLSPLGKLHILRIFHIDPDHSLELRVSQPTYPTEMASLGMSGGCILRPYSLSLDYYKNKNKRLIGYMYFFTNILKLKLRIQ